jgi:hypothetical protein
MGAVAERLAVVVAFAAAQGIGLRFIDAEFDRLEIRTLVRAVAEGLFAAFTAGTPEIVFALFQIGHIGKFLGDDGVGHV